jgi:hypothetical protein
MCIPRLGEKSEAMGQVGTVCGRRDQDDPSRVQQRSWVLVENLQTRVEEIIRVACFGAMTCPVVWKLPRDLPSGKRRTH